MKFATIAHLDNEELLLKQIPKEWIQKKFIVSPEIDCNGTKGHFMAIKIPSKQMMEMPREKVRQNILDASLFAQDNLDVDIIQLGALTTSVTGGGVWLTEQTEYKGFVSHGDSYTAAVTCQAVEKALNMSKMKPSDLNIAIVGCYGIIGEAVSKILVPKFHHSILIGRRERKLVELAAKLNGNFETTIDLKTKNAEVVVTATSHTTALLNSDHLKEKAIIVDVSQPVNLPPEVCQKRPDICRIDGGYVDFISEFRIPGIPPGKIFSCIVEVIMQAMENEHKNHVGSIDLKHLKRTEKWAEKYGYTLNELTNFGKPVDLRRLSNESKS